MARQISSHCGVGDESIAPQDVQRDLSSNNSNVAASNSLISSSLKFGTIIFKDKYIGPVRWSESWLKLAEKHCSG